MGQSAGVPIEPDEQSELLDACCAIPGVIGGGVPGGKSGFVEGDWGPHWLIIFIDSGWI